jgi:hypothetical protein
MLDDPCVALKATAGTYERHESRLVYLGVRSALAVRSRGGVTCLG